MGNAMCRVISEQEEVWGKVSWKRGVIWDGFLEVVAPELGLEGWQRLGRREGTPGGQNHMSEGTEGRKGLWTIQGPAESLPHACWL